MIIRFFLVGIMSLLSTTIISQTKLPTFFGDNMVLQQNQKVAIWGKDEANISIEVYGSWGQKATTKSDKSGNWKLFLQTSKAGGPYSLIIKGSKQIQFHNILLGEVWLCMGQSNMGWTLKNTFNGKKDALNAQNINLRIYKSDRQHWHEPKTDCVTGSWLESNPTSASNTSAVSYYFAQRLQKELGVPVGIIVQAYAGTPIESWMPWEVQSSNKRSIYHKKKIESISKRQVEQLGLTIENALIKYQKELDLYTEQKSYNPMNSKNIKSPIITKPAVLGNQFPANVYNALVHPLLGFGIKGIIWYQGERNSKSVQQASDFKKQLQLMIGFYREKWYEMSDKNVTKDLYFSMTQLPSWNPAQTKPIEGVEAPWTVSRNMMLEILSNTGVVISIDTGDSILLHPRNKKPIGYRHAFNVLHDVYKKNIVAHGPYFKGQKIQKNKIILTFNGIGSGLLKEKNKKLNAFAIAGVDQKWEWAEAKIVDSTIVVTSAKIPKPVAVRYAWSMNPSKRNLLYNKEGLPASPFRTDSWSLYEQGSEEVQVFKPRKEKGYKPKDWIRPKMQ